MTQLPPHNGTLTSAAAAASVAAKVPSMEDRVFAIIRKRPRTCWEIELSTGWAHQTTSARFNGLAKKRKIIITTETRPTGTGCAAFVYRETTPTEQANATSYLAEVERVKSAVKARRNAAKRKT